MAEEKFSPEESIRLIQSMIHKTKQNISDNSIYFLVWGWITFIACTGQFVLKHIYHSENITRFGGSSSSGLPFRSITACGKNGRARSKSYVDDSIKYLWIGMGLAYFVLSMILTSYGWDKIVFPFFIMLYGLGTFISGQDHPIQAARDRRDSRPGPGYWSCLC